MRGTSVRPKRRPSWNTCCTNWAWTAEKAALARRSCSLGGSPRRLESLRAASAAAWAWRWLARRRFWNSPAIWFTAVLMKVPGPNTTFAASSSAISRQTGGRLPSPSLLSGTLPDRQPSSRISRPRSAVSTVRASSPRTSTSTASSPKSCLKRSVSSKLCEPRSTSVSVAALGWRRSASAAPPSASSAVTASTGSGWRATPATSRAKRSPFLTPTA